MSRNETDGESQQSPTMKHITTREAVLQCFDILIDTGTAIEGSLTRANQYAYEVNLQNIRLERRLADTVEQHKAIIEQNEKLEALLAEAWGVIANVGIESGGGWRNQSTGWRAAASEWRSRFYDMSGGEEANRDHPALPYPEPESLPTQG